MKRTIIFLYLSFLISTFSYSSNIFQQDLDSLKRKTYDELIQIIYDDNIDLSTKEYCVDIFHKKSKNDNSTIKENKIRRIAEAFRNRSYLASLKKDEVMEIAYLDSIINFTIDKNVWNYPSFAYYVKGLTLYDRKDFKNSLDSFIEAHKFSKRNQNLSLLYDIKYSIATLKSRIGEHQEALEIFRDCYNQEKITIKTQKGIDNLLVILQALSDEYRRNKKIDSSSIYNKEGITLSLNEGYKEYLRYFSFSEGINHFERGNYKVSMDSIYKSLPFLEKINDRPNLAFAYLYLGKINKHLEEDGQTIRYYKSVDSLFQETKFVHPDLREVYEYLINYYKTIDDETNQLLYTEKLIQVDQVLVDDYKYLSKNLMKKFDTPELLASKESLIKVVNKDKRNLMFIIFGLVSITFLLLIFVIVNILKKQKYRKIVEEIIQSQPSKKEDKPKKIDVNLGVPEDIIDQILLGLNAFEDNKEFVKNTLTLNVLAKKLNTNTKYLSKVINHYHKKTFINYINSLRIDYTIEKLKKEKKYRNYTVKAISGDMGFKNPESFSQAFFKNKGVYPSFFIKELNKSLFNDN